MGLTIRNLTILGGVLYLGLLAALTLGNLAELDQSRAALAGTAGSARWITGPALELIQGAETLAQDTSAIHRLALAGAGGSDPAAHNGLDPAARFRQDLERVRGLAARLEDPAVNRAVAAVGAAFPAFERASRLPGADANALAALGSAEENLRDALSGVTAALQPALNRHGENLASAIAAQSHDQGILRWIDWGGLLLGATLSLTTLFLTSRKVLVPLRNLADCVGHLAAGERQVAIPSLAARDEIGDIARALLTIKESGARAVRAQAGLDAVSAAVLLLDLDGRVIHANPAAAAAVRLAGQNDPLALDLGKALGQDLSAVEDGTRLKASFGAREARLVVNPVLNHLNERLGTVVEWIDQTESLGAEAELSALVDAAAEGDFSRRIAREGKTGFNLLMADGLNTLIDTADRGLTAVGSVIARLAEGDLTARMEGEFDGTFARLKADTNRMAEQLAALAGRILEATNAVRHAAEEISAGTLDLSARTEKQAASLEETAASMEELTATVRLNADNSQQAAEQASTAREAAVEGSRLAQSVVDAIGSIEEASQRIGDIVGLIDEIAFQTNLLALNAAVEAARAGEAGKGFAVVAAEVRSLAQRSSQASTDIQELIGNSDKEVERGVTLVHEAGASLEAINRAVASVADLIAEIANASREQATGLDEISNAVAQMDDATQKNAALVEQSTAAAQMLSTQSQDLFALVSFFRTGQETEGPAAPPAPSAPPVRTALSRRPAAAAPPPAAAPHKAKPAPVPAYADDDDWKEF